jgi:hypothetical protein
VSKLGIEWDRWEKYCLTITEIEHFRSGFKQFESFQEKDKFK